MTLVREFKCGISGDECVIVLNALGKEICILKQDLN